MEILIKKARGKDPDAFAALMEMNMQMMYKIGKSYLRRDEDVADAIQDTILACYEKIDTLKKNKYFKTWLVRILINKCQDYIRRNKQMSIIEIKAEEGVWLEDYNNLEWDQMLKCLEEKYRIILLLYYLEGFNTREIAQILDMNEKTVQTRLSRGRSKFVEIYKVQEK